MLSEFLIVNVITTCISLISGWIWNSHVVFVVKTHPNSTAIISCLKKFHMIDVLLFLQPISLKIFITCIFQSFQRYRLQIVHDILTYN